jgi:hypothetical protein
MLGEVRLLSGGAIDFWSLDYTARAGRGRRYHLALIDESAHDEGRLADSFPASIALALLDFNGSVITASTPNGLDGWFHDIVHDQRHGFAVFHAPTGANPFLPVEAIAASRAELPRPEVALQELDAQFVDTGGATIFPLAALLIDGEPHPDDFPCQAIGLAIDSNSGKGGPDRDGCAAVIFGVTLPGFWRGSLEGARCILLDWDIQSLAQGGVAPWLQHVRGLALTWFRRLKPLGGAPSAFIEGAGKATPSSRWHVAVKEQLSAIGHLAAPFRRAGEHLAGKLPAPNFSDDRSALSGYPKHCRASLRANLAGGIQVTNLPHILTS